MAFLLNHQCARDPATMSWQPYSFFGDYAFDDGGAAPLEASCAVVVPAGGGTLYSSATSSPGSRAAGALGALLAGAPAVGRWVLTLNDTVAGAQGFFTSAELALTSAATGAAQDAVRAVRLILNAETCTI